MKSFAVQLYRTHFEAFPLSAEKPPKLLPVPDMPYFFSLFSVRSSKMKLGEKKMCMYLLLKQVTG